MVIPVCSLCRVSPMALNFQDPVASVCVSSEAHLMDSEVSGCSGCPDQKSRSDCNGKRYSFNVCVCVLKNDNVFLLPVGVACMGWWGLRVCVVCEEMMTRRLEGKRWGLQGAPQIRFWDMASRQSGEGIPGNLAAHHTCGPVSSSCGRGHRGLSGSL